MHLLGYLLPRHGFLIRILSHRECAESSMKTFPLGLLLILSELEQDRRMDTLSYRGRGVNNNTTNEYILSYLKERNINYKQDSYEGTPCITMSFDGYPNSPSKRIETCIYFYSEASAIEARVYYALPGPNIVEERAEQLPELFRLLNFINASLFVQNEDGVGSGLYRPSYLLQPRFFLTEDGCNDITATLVMDEDMFWTAPLEVMDFITSGLPSLMNQLSPYIYGVLIGDLHSDMAINHIKHFVLEEEDGD